MLSCRLSFTLLMFMVVGPGLVWGQQEMRSATKGSSTPLPITGSVIDADHNALDVKCLSGCSGSGGGGVGVPTSLTIASAITTNTSTTPVAGVSGTKNFQWKVTGTGAVTQTVVLNGSFDSDGSSATDLCTITLSGTAPVYDVCAPFTAPFPYLFVTTTNTTGTGASGTGKVGY
jgi:hypothetical protein